MLLIISRLVSSRTYLFLMPHWEVKVKNMTHACLSANFTNQALRWSKIEKEGFAIMDTTERKHLILALVCGFDLTHHNNLVFRIYPKSVMLISQRQLFWAVRVCAPQCIGGHTQSMKNSSRPPQFAFSSCATFFLLFRLLLATNRRPLSFSTKIYFLPP